MTPGSAREAPHPLHRYRTKWWLWVGAVVAAVGLARPRAETLEVFQPSGVPPGEVYRVLLPQGYRKTRSEATNSSDFGDYKTNFSVATRHGRAYVVSSTTYPRELLEATGDSDKFLDGIVEMLQAEGTNQGHVRTKRAWSHQGLPGRELEVTGVVDGTPVVARFRLVLAGNRSFTLEATGLKESDLDHDNVRRFLDSLVIPPE